MRIDSMKTSEAEKMEKMYITWTAFHTLLAEDFFYLFYLLPQQAGSEALFCEWTQSEVHCDPVSGWEPWTRLVASSSQDWVMEQLCKKKGRDQSQDALNTTLLSVISRLEWFYPGQPG